MIILTEVSANQQAPAFISDGQGVWRFSFGGDEFYTDDQGEDFYWSGRQSIIDVRAVRFGPITYTGVNNLTDCRATEESFYWDAGNERLYVHHDENQNSFHLTASSLFIIATSDAGFATGQLPGQNQYFPTLFFDPLITQIGRLEKSVDTLKFGLLTFESSDFTVINAQAEFDNITDIEAFNAKVIFVLMLPGVQDINNGERLFSGFTGGVSFTDDDISIRLSESRAFYNRNVCPTLFDITTYPNLDPKFENKRIPVAYGDIRKGICVPIDSDGVETGDAATITFKLADESIHAILSVTALYDSNGDSVTLGTISLANCTVQYAKAAGKEVDLSKFTWEGTGYDIPGIYNNGLDIMKDAFVEQADYAYNNSTFVEAEWDAATIDNPEPVGVSIQNERGIVEEIIQPVTVSLQGIVDVRGDGRITFKSRDTTAAPVRNIFQYDILEGPTTEKNVDSVVSSVVINYAPNFSDNDDILSAIYDVEENEVASKYGILRTRPVSPIDTILTVESDALAVGVEIMSTSADPETLYEVTIPLDDLDTYLLDIVQVDVSRPHQMPDWKVCEVIRRTISFADNQLLLGFTLRLLPDRIATFGQNIITEDEIDIITEQTLEELATEN